MLRSAGFAHDGYALSVFRGRGRKYRGGQRGRHRCVSSGQSAKRDRKIESSTQMRPVVRTGITPPIPALNPPPDPLPFQVWATFPAHRALHCYCSRTNLADVDFPARSEKFSAPLCPLWSDASGPVFTGGGE